MTKRIFAILLLLTLSFAATAQEIYRSEFAHFDKRKDADLRNHEGAAHFIEFKPAASQSLYTQVVEMPQNWVDASTSIHIENPLSAYTLRVNGAIVAQHEDSISPAEFEIGDYLSVGSNTIEIETRHSKRAELEEGLAPTKRPQFEGSYIYNQRKVRILDYNLRVVPDEDPTHGRLLLDIIVENRFNYEEPIEVGYDIYDPTNKLIDFNTAKTTLSGKSIDTLSFAPYLYGAAKHKWNPALKSTQQPLYSVMLFTKLNGVSQEYIPLKVSYKGDGALPTLKSKRYNAATDKATTQKELLSIKKSGFNTISPDYPQPLWFYELCDKVGLYVIDQAAISAPTNSQDRSVGGTPSNNPKLLEEYLGRVKRAYYRSRNFGCVVAYSLGAESGNGYNMYKAYEWLKSIESERPIIYIGTNGEWNSDKLEIERK